MLLLFEAAADAVAYALAYQQALAALNPPLRARAGVHVGPVILRENTPSDVARGAKLLEVEGAAKAMAARVMAIANGGQTLLSADARSALGDIRLRVESHGHWRMKGIAEPMELFEVGEADAPFAPPPDAAKGYLVVRAGDVWLPAPCSRNPVAPRRLLRQIMQSAGEPSQARGCRVQAPGHANSANFRMILHPWIRRRPCSSPAPSSG